MTKGDTALGENGTIVKHSGIMTNNLRKGIMLKMSGMVWFHHINTFLR